MSGTTNKVVKFASASTVGNSNIFDDGTYVGVNTTAPAADLHVVASTKDDVAFKVEGSQGTLFEVVDNLDTLLQSVNDISGLPVWEVYADDRVVAYGTFQSSLKDAPGTPAADNSYSYITASGTTPTREIAAKIKFEDGSEFVIASVLV